MSLPRIADAILRPSSGLRVRSGIRLGQLAGWVLALVCLLAWVTP